MEVELAGRRSGKATRQRRALDAYHSASWYTTVLLRRVPAVHDVFEPCVGTGAISHALIAAGLDVYTNDLDMHVQASSHVDMTQREAWSAIRATVWPQRAWGVTNVPFGKANQIVPLAVEHLPSFATILRLSWLEPTGNKRDAGRQDFLQAHPPTRIIVLPRYSYTGNGKTDSVTSAWMIWDTTHSVKPGIEVVTKRERDALIASEPPPTIQSNAQLVGTCDACGKWGVVLTVISNAQMAGVCVCADGCK